VQLAIALCIDIADANEPYIEHVLSESWFDDLSWDFNVNGDGDLSHEFHRNK
jgi:hypothetical protein